MQNRLASKAELNKPKLNGKKRMSLAALLWLAAQATSAPTAPHPQMPLPAFLTGCHEERRAAGWTEECWTIPRSGSMMGSGRSGTGSEVTSWEWMRIERGSDGVPVFHASPRGAAPVPFRAISASDTEIVFANPAQDYPQRIRYARTAQGIEAEISLADGSKAQRWTFAAMSDPG